MIKNDRRWTVDGRSFASLGPDGRATCGVPDGLHADC